MTRLGYALLCAIFALCALAAGCTQEPEARFPHKAHLAATACGGPGQPACPRCASCHSQIRKPGGQALPTAADCAKCHTPGDQRVAIKTARQPDEREVRANLIFPHAKHLSQPQIRGQCVGCHTGVPEDGLAGTMFPNMDKCLECHDDQFKRGICAKCHQRGNLSKLVPRTFLRHGAEWLRQHGQRATEQESVCRQCHAESFCVDCHDSSQTLPLERRIPDAIERSLHHRADFLSRHPIEARAAGGRCSKCHEVSSCEGCHLERGVSAGRVGAANPHPHGWLGHDPNGPNYHGRHARRDILACASCHDQGPATNCIRCHKVGGPGGNPHPAGWKSSRSTSDTMCGYCHGS